TTRPTRVAKWHIVRPCRVSLTGPPFATSSRALPTAWCFVSSPMKTAPNFSTPPTSPPAPFAVRPKRPGNLETPPNPKTPIPIPPRCARLPDTRGVLPPQMLQISCNPVHLAENKCTCKTGIAFPNLYKFIDSARSPLRPRHAPHPPEVCPGRFNSRFLLVILRSEATKDLRLPLLFCLSSSAKPRTCLGHPLRHLLEDPQLRSRSCTSAPSSTPNPAQAEKLTTISQAHDSANANTSPHTAIIVSQIDQDFSVSGTLKLKYSFTSQNPPSFTCEKISAPAPVAIASSSGRTCPVCNAIGATIPAAVVMATVAEPVASRISAASTHARTSSGIWLCSASVITACATPLSCRTRPKPPP